MPTLVIGGHSRNVGKTSVVAGIIAALPEFHWTAAKITQYGHGVCGANGEMCDCATADHAWAITEERSRAGDSDTSRFLAAGAQKVWWVRTQQGRLAEAMPALRARLAGAENVILESNSVMRFLRPDLYITVLDPAKATTIRKEMLHESDYTPWEGQEVHAWPTVTVLRGKVVVADGKFFGQETDGQYLHRKIDELIRSGAML